MRVALDTNVLAYAEGVIKTAADVAKIERARLLLDRLLRPIEVVVPVQVRLELANVLVRKARLGHGEAARRAAGYRTRYATAATDDAVATGALELARRHKLQVFDAAVLAAAASARCELLLTEDAQSLPSWRGVELVDPFAGELDAVLARLGA